MFLCVVLLGFLPVFWVWSVGVLVFGWCGACVLWCGGAVRCYVGCLAVVVRVCCGVVVLYSVILRVCDECLTSVVGCAVGVGFVSLGCECVVF